ncbi:MAG: uracil-DNA glycosylase [Rhodospirillaceae bacterium]
MSGPSPAQPGRDCGLCPRLVDFRHTNRATQPDWFNAPVPAFGGLNARLLVVGMAPGLRGANRTGRPFTGDYAGDLLYATLIEFGFAEGAYDSRADDGLALVDCRVTNAVRCVPPENKPVGAEVTACRPFLVDEIAALPRLRVILALGGLSHGAVLAALGERKSAWRFAHDAEHRLPEGPLLIDSYHCSRYNTNTGRLTPPMFHDVFQRIRRHLDAAA